MRVALDVTPLAGPKTGIGRFVSDLAIGLRDEPDLDLVGLALTARGRGTISDVLGEDTVLSRPAPARLLRKAWTRGAWPAVELLTGSVDLVHGTNYVVPPTRRAVSLVSVHDLSAWQDPSLVHDSSRVYPELVRRALDRGAHVHAISEFVGREIQQMFGVQDDHLHVVHLGLPPSPNAVAGAGRALVDGKSYVLAIGTIEPRKDFPLLVEAFAKLAPQHSDLRLAIAGGAGWGHDALIESIERHGLDSRVQLLGFVSDQQKADLLHDAEIVVSSARYEGFGFVPLEAMAAGTPVVAASGGAIPEVCGGAAKLVPVHDAEALAQALTNVLEDPALANELIERGAKRSAEFGHEQTLAKMLRVYRRLLDNT